MKLRALAVAVVFTAFAVTTWLFFGFAGEIRKAGRVNSTASEMTGDNKSQGAPSAEELDAELSKMTEGSSTPGSISRAEAFPQKAAKKGISERKAVPQLRTSETCPSTSVTALRHTGISGSRDAWVRPELGEWALVSRVGPSIGWCDIFDEPSQSSTRVAQGLVGDKIEVIDESPGWFRVASIPAGWEGWVRAIYVTAGSDAVRNAWKTGPFACIVAAPGVDLGVQGYIPFGAVLPLAGRRPGVARLRLPDGRLADVDAEHSVAVDEFPPLSAVLEAARGLRRVRYQDGGNSLEAMDGAGLVWLVFRVAGQAVPRQLAEQLVDGESIDTSSFRTGDVIYLSAYHDDQRRSVIVLDDDGTFLEATPSSGVALGVLDQLRNRKILEVRRFGNDLMDNNPANDKADHSQAWWKWLFKVGHPREATTTGLADRGAGE